MSIKLWISLCTLKLHHFRWSCFFNFYSFGLSWAIFLEHQSYLSFEEFISKSNHWFWVLHQYLWFIKFVFMNLDQDKVQFSTYITNLMFSSNIFSNLCLVISILKTEWLSLSPLHSPRSEGTPIPPPPTIKVKPKRANHNPIYKPIP